MQKDTGQGAVYLQTNDDAKNEVVAYDRAADGTLTYVGAYETGGRGTGKPHLPSQSSVVLTEGGRQLLVVNAGSNEISLFTVEDGSLRLANTISSGGSTPTSIAVHGELVYVLNNGSASIDGFAIADGRLQPLADSKRPLSEEGADGAQIAFSPDGKTLVVTERGTNSISAYAIDELGYAEGPATIPAVGQTPYGFDFTESGALVVTEAFGGDIGRAAASSYAVAAPGELKPVSGSVGDTRSEVCWAAVTKDGRFVFVTNFGDGTISSYGIGSGGEIELAEPVAASTRLGEAGIRDEAISSNGRFVYVTNFGDGTISSYGIDSDGEIELAEPVAASTRLGEAGIRDEAISSNGRFLYALDADAQKVHGWNVGSDGRLAEIGAFEGLPPTVAGLAAS